MGAGLLINVVNKEKTGRRMGAITPAISVPRAPIGEGQGGSSHACEVNKSNEL
jgi:hypothetical protein